MSALCWKQSRRNRRLIALALQRRRQRWDFADTLLAIHLLNHEGLPAAKQENRIDHLKDHLNWDQDFTARVVRLAERHQTITRQNGRPFLTEQGRQQACEAIVRQVNPHR